MIDPRNISSNTIFYMLMKTWCPIWRKQNKPKFTWSRRSIEGLKFK